MSTDPYVSVDDRGVGDPVPFEMLLPADEFVAAVDVEAHAIEPGAGDDGIGSARADGCLRTDGHPD